ncbi:hypothetical protein NLJ89_g10525 [Agrocybe chaxingu]|uniref:Uncharacterized protein n=1 Tax=Agrocybe chaxingu TaxID=84603 RepID=A0A9W8MS19_9AGAR|nr:hypothetical protein NLJ89_g10525 [Agrocybe chaxingu]
MDTKAYAQWVIVLINNKGSEPLKLKSLNVITGKLYADGNKDVEVPASDYEGKVVAPGEKLQFNSCGLANTPEGTSGTFDLVDPIEDDKLIRHFYWNCPWGSHNNEWEVTGTNSKWVVESHSNGMEALGVVTVDAMNK